MFSGEIRDILAASMIHKAIISRTGMHLRDSIYYRIEEIPEALLRSFDSFCEHREYYEAAAWLVEQSRQTEVGMMAPPIIAFDTTGRQWALAQTLGHPVLLCFWIPIDEEDSSMLHTIQYMYEAYGDSIQFATVALTCDVNTWKGRLRHLSDKMICLYAPQGLMGDLARTYGFHQNPQYCLLDNDGRIILPPSGDEDLVKDTIRQLLRKK